MIEITREVSGIAMKLENLSDAMELVEWGMNQPNLAVTVAAKANGDLLIQCEGAEISTVYPTLGNWIVFNGDKFFVYEDNSAFTAAGYEIPGE